MLSLEILKAYSVFCCRCKSLGFYMYFHPIDDALSCFGNDLLKELLQLPHCRHPLSAGLITMFHHSLTLKVLFVHMRKIAFRFCLHFFKIKIIQLDHQNLYPSFEAG